MDYIFQIFINNWELMLSLSQVIIGFLMWMAFIYDRYRISKSLKGLYGSGSFFEFKLSDILSLIFLMLFSIPGLVLYTLFGFHYWIESLGIVIFKISLNNSGRITEEV